MQQLREIYVQALRLHIKTDDLPDDDLLAVLSIDSVKAMEILITVETTFDIEFDSEHLNAKILNSFETLADFLLAVNRNQPTTMEK